MATPVLQAPKLAGTSGPRRPKLSLQTATVQTQAAPQMLPKSVAQAPPTASPTTRNTQANSKSNLAKGSPNSPHRSKPTTISPRTTNSPLFRNTSSRGGSRNQQPYTNPFGPRPILRNSPLRSRTNSPRSPRSPRRYFPPKKHVNFRDSLTELMPTPVIEVSETDSDPDTPPHAADALGIHGETKSLYQATPVRRKKTRDWRWTIGSDSPAEGKFLRGKDQRPVYPRTPIPGDEDSDAESTEEEEDIPLRVPLPNTPGTPGEVGQVGKSEESLSTFGSASTDPGSATPTKTTAQASTKKGTAPKTVPGPLADTPTLRMPQRKKSSSSS